MSPYDPVTAHRQRASPVSTIPSHAIQDRTKKYTSSTKVTPWPRAPSTCSTASEHDSKAAEWEGARQGNDRPTTPGSGKKHLLKLWMLETACILISVCTFLVIITVLNAFDNQPLPKLPIHMTLNTFLAFFTTFTKAAFIYPVVQCISQWKWNWFATNDERPLADFHTFDNASRGIIGSIGLLRLLKYRHIAAVGAIISLTSIATTPITQLLIEYPSRLVQVTPGSPDFPGATTRAVEHYQSRVGLIGSWSLDVSNYVSSGLVHPTDSLIPELSPSCSSGTCTWEPIESLALCSKVTNITDNLVIQQVPFSTADDWTAWDSYIDEDSLRLNGTLAYNISFSGLDNNTDSNEYFIAPVSYTVYSSSTSASTKSFPDGTALSRARVAGYKVIWADAGNVTYTSGNTARSDPWRWQAFEMIYYVCVNTYSVRVDNGTAKTELLSSTYDVVAHDDDDDESTGVKINCTAPKVVSGGAQFTDCVQDGRNPNLGLLTLRGSLNNSTGEHKNYTADIRSLTLLAKYITQDSTGIWAWDGMDHMVLAGNSGLPTLAHAVYGYVSADDQGGTDRVGNSSGSALLSDGNGDAGLQSQRLHNLANNVAVSITNGFRSIPPYRSTPNSFPVVGTVLSPETYIHVRWGWLAFLVVQLVASIVLFVCTVLATRRMPGVPVVKSSALATLFALPGDMRHRRGDEVGSPAPHDRTNLDDCFKRQMNDKCGCYDKPGLGSGSSDESTVSTTSNSKSRSQSCDASDTDDGARQLEAQRPVRRDTSIKAMKQEAKQMMARMEGGVIVLMSQPIGEPPARPGIETRRNTMPMVNKKCQRGQEESQPL